MNRLVSLRLVVAAVSILAGCDGGTAGSVNQRLGELGNPPRNDGTCNPGLTVCNGTCVDPITDGKHCGACGVVCGQGKVCEKGACAPAIACGQVLQPCCPGNVCNGPLICAGGTCVPSDCSAGQIDCNGRCVDPTSDSNHCGGCGKACPQGTNCAQGACVPVMNPCGAKGQPCCQGACQPGLVCQQNVCAPQGCPMGRITCNGLCVDPATDAQNCGACGVACGPGKVCAKGACGPAANCGALFQPCCPGNVCDAMAVCVAGTCQPNDCPPKLLDCGGRCVDPTSDSNHCGGCGKACPQGTNCAQGACVPVMNPCGAKGQPCCQGACQPGLVCQQNVCAPQGCPMGRIACNNACVDPATDAQNCGACGVACGPGKVCSKGACAPAINCGLVAQPCCPGNTCQATFICVAGSCVAGD